MVRIRLTRVGGKKNPIWRVVVADQRSPRDGRVIENVGTYNPQTEPSLISLKQERLAHWIEQGAKPTDTVVQLMKTQSLGADGKPTAVA
ncbi:MAG: 30S ribosomal protein S16 [Solirubrobacterales bacterium]